MAATVLTDLRSGIVPVLQAMQAQLVAASVVPVERCFLVARDPVKTERYQGPQEVYLRPLGFLADDPNVTGGGRIDTRFTRSVEITLRTRNDRDQSGQDPHFLTDIDTHFALEEAVVNALQLFFPVDSSGNGLVIAGIRVMSGTLVERSIEDDLVGWSKLIWEVIYYPPIDTTVLG